MRSILTLSFTLLALSLFAQAPQGIKYQAVARDNSGALYVNRQIAVRFTIIDSVANGETLYVERQTLNTSDFGLFTATLGQGAVQQGVFASINWGVNSKYLKVEFDPNGGTNFFDMGTAQLLSVPYALYSEKAGAAGNSTDSQTLSISGNTLSISNGNSVTLPGGSGSSYTAGTGIDLTGNVITNTSPDQQVVIIGTGETVVSGTYPTFSVNTSAQNLSLNGNVLSISNGNSVTLPSGGGGSYVAGTGINITGTTISNTAPDQTVTLTGAGITTIGGSYPNYIITSSEVPQVLSLSGTTLNLSNGGGSVVLPVGADNDPTNELQTLTLNGNQLTISNGNTVSLPSGGLPDTDSDSTNELNTGALLNGTTLQITDAGGTLQVDLSSLLNDNDSDPTNELNTALTLSGTTLSVTDAAGSKSVDLASLANDADSNPSNEIQILSLTGDTLSLSNGGGSVTLPSGSGSYTASNGVHITSGDIQLGGALTANTDIPLSGYALSFSGTGNVGIGITPNYPLHVSASNTSSAVVSSNTNAAGIGVTGQNTAAVGAGAGIGVYGATQQANGYGVYGSNLSTSGTGIIGIGNNIASITPVTGGAGGAFYGALTGVYGFTSGNTGYGVYGKATDPSSSYGVVGIANNVQGAGPPQGAGGAFSGYDYGVSGIQTDITPNVQTAAGYFVGGANTGAQVTTLVEAFSTGNVHYKIWGSNPGSVSTCVPDLNGNPVTLHAPETPEFYFQDYGQGKLRNGRAHIDIDPILAKNVAINEKHPLRVFIQLEGDCNGVFVTNKTATGFDVVELNGGTSDVAFQWSITCNVADAVVGNRLSKFSDLRFEPGPVDVLRPFNEKK